MTLFASHLHLQVDMGYGHPPSASSICEISGFIVRHSEYVYMGCLGLSKLLLFTDLTIRGRLAVGLNPNMRLIGISEFKPKSDVNGSHDSSEPLVGGETVFYGSRNSLVAEVSPTQGMALFHLHGAKMGGMHVSASRGEHRSKTGPDRTGQDRTGLRPSWSKTPDRGPDRNGMVRSGSVFGPVRVGIRSGPTRHNLRVFGKIGPDRTARTEDRIGPKPWTEDRTEIRSMDLIKQLNVERRVTVGMEQAVNVIKRLCKKPPIFSSLGAVSLDTMITDPKKNAAEAKSRGNAAFNQKKYIGTSAEAVKKKPKDVEINTCNGLMKYAKECTNTEASPSNILVVGTLHVYKAFKFHLVKIYRENPTWNHNTMTNLINLEVGSCHFPHNNTLHSWIGLLTVSAYSVSRICKKGKDGSMACLRWLRHLLHDNIDC
nr:2-oxoglutarate (2OG) and Fe(II)-dependent oxygenase superfamily protein [Tanacetum cinerariifolium]